MTGERVAHGLHRTVPMLLLALVVLVLVSLLGCSSGQDWLGTSSTSALQPANNSAASHLFVSGLIGEGYATYKLEQGHEGLRTVVVVGVRADAADMNQATYDAIYEHATTSAKRYG